MNWRHVSSCQWLTDTQAATSVVLLILILGHMASLPLHHHSHLPWCSHYLESSIWFPVCLSGYLPICFQSIAELSLFSLPMLQQCTYLNCLPFFSSGFCWIAYFLAPTPFFLSSSIRLTQIREKGNIRDGKEDGVRDFRWWWNRLGKYFYLACKI